MYKIVFRDGDTRGLKVLRSWCQLGLIVMKKKHYYFKKELEARLAYVRPGIGSFMSSVLLFLAEANELVSLHW